MIYEFMGVKPQIAKSAVISDSATIIGNVIIGECCFIGPGAVLRTDAPDNQIIVGDYSVIEDLCLVHLGGPGAICEIGKHVTVGHNAIVHGRLLDDYSNVGMGAILSIASEVGKYSVVAEGAVVKLGQKIPERVVVGGAPAKVLRQLEDRDIEMWTMSNKYYEDLGNEYKVPGALKPVTLEECEV